MADQVAIFNNFITSAKENAHEKVVHDNACEVLLPTKQPMVEGIKNCAKNFLENMVTRCSPNIIRFFLTKLSILLELERQHYYYATNLMTKNDL